MNKTFIISGDVHGGKTTFASNLANLFVENGFNVDGFVCLGVFKNEERTAFDIQFLATNDMMPFANNEHVKGWTKFKRFYFNPSALTKGNNLLKEVDGKEKSIVFVDELGRWEIEDGGWSEGINGLIENAEVIKVFVVRDAFVNEIKEKFNLKSAVVINIQNESVQNSYERITRNLITHKTTM